MEKIEVDKDIEDFLRQIKEGIIELKVGVCPVWQCGGELEYIEERTNWQEPDLKCKSCGNVWLIQKYTNEEDEGVFSALNEPDIMDKDNSDLKPKGI